MFILLAAALAVQVPDGAVTGPHVADVRTFQGSVTLSGKESGTRAPERLGRRIRNRSIFDEDTVATGAGATCSTVFPDSTTVTLEAGAKVQILQKHLKAPTAEGQTVGRRIRLLVGDVVTQIIPSGSVKTEVETPVGTASVRGTTIRFTTDAAGLTTMTMVAGSAEFLGANNQVLFRLSEGQSIRFRFDPATRGLTADILAAAGAAVTARVGGREVRFNGQAQVQVTTADNQVRVQAQPGQMEVQGEGGQWQPSNDLLTAQDPTLAVIVFTDSAPSASDPSFSQVLAEPDILGVQDPTTVINAESFSTVVVNVGTTTTSSPTEATRSIFDIELFRSVALARELPPIATDDAGNILDGSWPTHNAETEAELALQQSRFESGVPALTIANEQLADLDDDWFTFSDPSRRTPWLQGDSGFDPQLWSFNAVTSDLQTLASNLDNGRSFDPQLWGRTIIGLYHAEIHIIGDSDPNFATDSQHSFAHSDIDGMHNHVLNGEFQLFTHDFMYIVHNRWHSQFSVTGACASGTDFTSGVCKEAHEAFHSKLNVFHDSAHEVLGISGDGFQVP